eukprot:GSMAST32.ASY1.ANO1.1953.1 assembled CDS
MRLFIYHFAFVHTVAAEASFVLKSYECVAGFDCMYQNSCANDEGVSCPIGRFCGRPSSFPNGLFQCDDDRWRTSKCATGAYCPTTVTNQKCEAGYFCPRGSVKRVKCSIGSICGEASHFPIGFLLFGFAILLFIFYILCRRFCLTTKIGHTISNDGCENKKELPVSKKLKMPFPLQFEFDNICWNFRDKPILRGVSGSVKAGEMIAIMGPSGAGKSTLVNCLMSRYTPSTGTVTINGYKDIEFSSICGITGYVPQDDIMLAKLTVRENLMHSANTRINSQVKANYSSKARVDSVLTSLGLEHVQHCIVGDTRKRGLSGGEKKRVSIGLELVASPSAIFLDEPTTGLDSSAAEVVINQLKLFANEGHAVIVILHQPRASIFKQFDNILCLTSRGETFYFGSPLKVRDFLNQIQNPCPSGKNPADHLIDIATKKGKVSMTSTPTSISDKSKTISENTVKFEDPRLNIKGKLASWGAQFLFYWKRSCVQQLRDSMALYLYCGLVFLMVASLSTGFSPFIQENLESVYKPPLGKSLRDYCPPHNKACSGSINDDGLIQMMFFYCMSIGSIGMLAASRTFYRSEMIVMKRESNIGLSSSACIIAKVFADLNVIILLSLLASGLWLAMGYPGGPVRWFVLTFSLLFTCYGWGYFVSQIVSDDMIMTVCMVTALGLSAFNGVNPKLVDVPWPWRTIWGMGYSRWISEAIFSTFTMHDRNSGLPVQFAASRFGYDVSDNQFILDIVVVVIQGTLLRIFTGFLIVKKNT